MKEISLIEKKIQNEYLDTGIIDLAAGLYFIAIAIASNVSSYLIMAIIFGIIMGYNTMKTRVIEPRIGLYKFSISKSTLYKIQNRIVVIFTLLFIVLIVLSRLGVFVMNKMVLTTGVCLTILLLGYLASQLFGTYRLLLYSAVLTSIVLFMNSLSLRLGERYAIIILMVIPGTLITIYGLFRMMRFLKTHPRIDGDEYE
jgi:hypothetical protein